MLPVPRSDRVAHFFYGAHVSLAVFFLATLVWLNTPLREAVKPSFIYWCALGACTLAALAKEGADWWFNRKARASGGKPPYFVERADISWTIYGGLHVCAPAIAVIEGILLS